MTIRKRCNGDKIRKDDNFFRNTDKFLDCVGFAVRKCVREIIIRDEMAKDSTEIKGTNDKSRRREQREYKGNDDHLLLTLVIHVPHINMPEIRQTRKKEHHLFIAGFFFALIFICLSLVFRLRHTV